MGLLEPGPQTSAAVSILSTAALSLLMLTGCDNNPPTDAPIRITLDTESPDSQCQSSLCSDYKMSCGAKVSVRLTDPDTGDVLERPTGEPLALCLDAPVTDDEDICVLSQLDMQIFGMPARTMRVEVALWNPDDLADLANGACPSPGQFDLFDTFGRPQSNYDPQPAFAGAAYFRAGEDESVTVPLHCTRPDLLDIDSCAANFPTDVFARVTDIATVQPLRKEDATNIEVSLGEPRLISNEQGDSTFVLEAADLFRLNLDNGGATPVYKDEIAQRFGDRVCSTTLEGTAQATLSTYCEEVELQAPELNLSPILVPKEIVDAALAALGLSSFPNEGMVIGRVVDEASSPSAGVAVTPSLGSVLYLSDDLSSTDPTLSSNSGYFVSLDAPYDALWTASHFDGRRQSAAPRAGLIEGKVSGLIIRMTGEVIPE